MTVNARTAPILVVLAAFLAGLALLAGVVFLTADRSAAAIGGPFHLVDQNGRPFSSQDMKGKPHLVYFGYTHCPDICPTILAELSALMRKLGPDADRVGALFITVDPERDTPATLKAYLAHFNPHLRGLTGTRSAIDAAMKEYQVYAKRVPPENGGYSIDHTAMVYLMNRQGRFVAPFKMKRSIAAEATQLRRYF